MMDKVSEAILALKPLIFRYKHELDPNGISRVGVRKGDPGRHSARADGKVSTVRDEVVNADLSSASRDRDWLRKVGKRGGISQSFVTLHCVAPLLFGKRPCNSCEQITLGYERARSASSRKLSGTLLSSSFRDVYENKLLV
jgi:hypothetical protein